MTLDEQARVLSESIGAEASDAVPIVAAALREAKAEGMEEAAKNGREFSTGIDIEVLIKMPRMDLVNLVMLRFCEHLDARAAAIREGKP